MGRQLLLLSITFVAILNIAFAQKATITLRGKVLTSDGQPAWGLTLSIKNTNYISYTDKEGAFKISAPAGSAILVIKSGVSSEVKEIAFEAITDKTLAPISIKEKSYELNEVVVTGQYEAQSLKNSVYKVRGISAEKIRLRAAVNIQQLLNTEFGFRFSNDLTLGTSDVEMMGMSGRNVKILLDGVPLVDRSDLRESLNQIDINTVEKIEIIEGPMSVVYGTDALAGVINIITKKAGAESLSITARIHEETAGDEYDFWENKGTHNKNVTASWRNKGWSVLAGASKNTFGGWNVPPKTATKADFDNPNLVFWKPKDQYLGNAKIGYSNQNFNIWYRLEALNEDIISRGGINPNYTVLTQTYTTDRINNQLHGDWLINNKLTLNVSTGYTSLQRKTTTKKYDFATSTESLSTGQGEQDLARFFSTIFRGTLQYKASNIISFQPGLEYNRDAGDGARIKGKPAIIDYAVFASAEIKPISFLKLRPGLRFIKNTVYDAPKAIPSLNTMVNLTKDLDLRLGYGRGFRAPALRELYFDFFDTSHSIMGNENLKAEKSNSFDGSLTWNALTENQFNLKSTLSGFYNEFFDRIDYGISAQDPTVTTLINISSYKTTGLALDNTINYKNLQANVGASLIGRYNRLTKSDLQNEVPEFSWTPEVFSNLSYHFTKLRGAVSLFFKYTGSRPSYQIDNNNTSTAKLVKVGAFSWSDLMLNKTINKYITLNAGVKNLFDVTSLSNTATASGGAHSTGGASVSYSYGRSYVFGITANWTKK